jgi:hypothetical protein
MRTVRIKASTSASRQGLIHHSQLRAKSLRVQYLEGFITPILARLPDQEELLSNPNGCVR